MLLNNLDAEVAERPEELVVYGGSGKAARNPEALQALVRSLLTLGDDETLLVQSGKPVGVFRTSPAAPRVLIANSLLVPRWATWDEFRRLEALGLTMFGQMTAGSWIYIGTPGDPAGDVPDVRRGRREALRLRRPGRADDPDRRARRDGRRPAARGDAGRRGDPLRRGRPRADRAPARDAVPRRGVRVARRRAGARAGRRGARAGRSRSACSATPPRSCPSSRARGEHFDLVTDQTAAHDPLNGYVPVGLDVERPPRCARRDPDEYLRRAARVDRAPRRGDARVRPGRQLCFRLWQQPERGGATRQASRTPSHTRASSRPISGRSSVAGSGRSAGRRSRAIRRTSPPSTGCSWSCSRTMPPSSAGCRSLRSASRSRASRRGSAGSATAIVPAPGWRSTSSSAAARSRRRS